MDAAEMSLWRRLRYTRMRDALRGRFDASLDRERIVADAGLPTEVGETILHVVRRTKLWRSEQVDVAKELVAHFQDGLAAGQSPQQLIASFGDPETASQLIRRSKKRGRPIVWYLWHYGWLTVAALASLYILAGLYLVAGRPSIKTDYLAIINQRALSVPEDERAWPLYRKALGQILEKRVFPKWAGNSELAPKDAEWTDAVNWLNGHQSALQLIREATKRRDLGFPVRSRATAFDPEDRKVLNELGNLEATVDTQSDEPLVNRDLIATLVPQLQALRSISKLLMIDTRRAALEGEGDTALADVTAILGVGRHAQETPFLVATFVGVAVQKIAYAAIQETLTDHPDLWTVAQLRDLAHSVAGPEIDWQRGMDGERAAICDVLQRLYTDDGKGGGRITAEGLRRLQQEYSTNGNVDSIAGVTSWRMRFGDIGVDALAPASPFFMASRADALAKYDALMSQQKAKMDHPFWELSRADLNDPVHAFSEAEMRRYLPLALLATPDIRINIETHAGIRDGLLIGIALECYRRNNGDRLPKSLDELAPAYLPRLPADRIAGGPLHYKIVDDRPVVYSVGIDRDDDGGRVPIGDDGEANANLASPYFAGSVPVADSAHDGDWVIWSTAKAEKAGQRSE